MNKISLGLIMLSALCSNVFADTITTPLTASALLRPTCSLSIENISFGSITPASTGVQQATSTMVVTCTKGITYSLLMSKGGGNSYANRSMGGSVGNTDRLKYNLYLNSAYVNYYGDGVTFGTLLTPTSIGGSETTTIYGQLNLNQYIKADNYSDSLTMTLTY